MSDSATLVFRPIFLEDLATSPAVTQTTATILGLGPGIPVTPILAAATDAAAIAAGLNHGDVYLQTGLTPWRLRSIP